MKSKQALIFGLAAFVIGGAAVGTALVATGSMSMGQGTTVVKGGGNQQQTSNTVTVERKNVKADLGYTVNGTAVLIQKEDAPSTQRPEYWGDYVDFSMSEALSGLRPGKDYYKVSLSSQSSVKFTNVAPGDYVLAIEDGSSTRVIHDFFKKGVNVDASVPKYKVEGSSTATQHLSVSVDAVQTVKEDRTVIMDAKRQGVAIGTDLGISGNNTDVVRYVKRTVSLKDGQTYLGDMTFSNVNALGEVTSMTLVETTVDGNKVSGASDITLYNSATGVDKIESDAKWNYLFGQSSNPTKAGQKVSFIVKLNYDSGTGGVSDGDGTLQNGEAAFDSVIDSIYGNAVAAQETITG